MHNENVRESMCAFFSALLTLVLAFPVAAYADPPAGDPVGPDHVGCNATEIMTEHIHPHLAIVHDGRKVNIPANIGFVQVAGFVLCIYWLHTHDDSGTIHIEAPGGNYTLADFFAVWGEPLSRTQAGPFKGHVRAYVDGKVFRGAPQSIPLRDGEQITLLL